MDALIALLTDYGYVGMFISAFIAGSVFPLSSEVVMLALLAAGLDPWLLVAYATVGNTLGSMFNYGIGTLGRIDWVEKYLHISSEKLERTQRLMAGHGAWIGFFAFLPIIGSVLTVALGLMRANILVTIVSVTLGKVIRYVLIACGVSVFI